MKQQLSQAGKSGWTLIDLLADFHLLLFLTDLLGMDEVRVGLEARRPSQPPLSVLPHTPPLPPIITATRQSILIHRFIKTRTHTRTQVKVLCRSVVDRGVPLGEGHVDLLRAIAGME